VVSVAAILLATAERAGAGLIVMGGRMRQVAFSGVTNHVMQNAALAVLMTHLNRAAASRNSRAVRLRDER
jgi:nucleotide-binding universal stress UspA family protein